MLENLNFGNIFQEGAYRDKYSFIGEWYDNQASLSRRYNVFFYPTDDSLEMFDLKTRKTFVRRVKVNGITLDSFYIGATLYILGRLVKIVDFASEDTRKKLHKDVEVYETLFFYSVMLYFGFDICFDIFLC